MDLVEVEESSEEEKVPAVHDDDFMRVHCISFGYLDGLELHIAPGRLVIC